MRSALLRWAGAGIVSLAIGGAAAHASTVTIVNTGPFSTNVGVVSTTTTITRTNTNSIGVSNSNSQSATSGSANSFFNTFGGNATSGNVSNWNSSTTFVSVTN